mgnify:CR=1 FL=1
MFHHCPRLSTNQAMVADCLTRSDVKGNALAAKWCDNLISGWPPALVEWMESPSIDWFLGSALVKDFDAKLKEL